MDTKAPVAVAIGVGYLLGRNHKLKWAAILGAAAATGQLNGMGAKALSRGVDMLKSTPELAGLTEGAGKLLDAARTATVSAMNSKATSMTDKMQDRAGRIGTDGAKAATDQIPRRGRRRDEDEEPPENLAEEDEYDEDEEEEDEENGERDEAEEDEFEDEEDEQESEERAGNGRRRSPVVRRSGR
jgi:hypothetical protein